MVKNQKPSHREKHIIILTLLVPSAGWLLPVVALWPLANCSFSLSTSLWAISALCTQTWYHSVTVFIQQPHQLANEMIKVRAYTVHKSNGGSEILGPREMPEQGPEQTSATTLYSAEGAV